MEKAYPEHLALSSPQSNFNEIHGICFSIEALPVEQSSRPPRKSSWMRARFWLDPLLFLAAEDLASSYVVCSHPQPPRPDEAIDPRDVPPQLPRLRRFWRQVGLCGARN